MLSNDSDAVACGPLWVSPELMCEVRVHGERVAMSQPRLRILACLLEAEGRVVARRELYERALKGRLRGGSRAIDLHIFHIRRALGPLGRFVVTVPRRGYRVDVIGLSALG